MTNFTKHIKAFFTGEKEEQIDPEVQKNKRDFEILKYDGIRAQRMGNVAQALKCFAAAVEISGEYETVGYLVDAYIQHGDLDEAVKHLLNRAESKPEDATNFIALANICYLQEKYSEMKEYSQKACLLIPNNVHPYLLLAKAERGMKNPLEAIAYLVKAICQDEDCIEAYLMRGEVLLELNQYKEAIEDAESVLAKNSQDEAALLIRAKAMTATENYEAAEKDYREVTDINPFNESAYLNLAELLTKQNKIEKALNCLDEAIDINPAFTKGYHERGKIRFLNNDHDGAAADLKKELELAPQEQGKINGEFDNFKNLYAGNPLG
ncbi:MAG: tetratricopeptide repeat protein [Bacteroidaceae bacterium]